MSQLPTNIPMSDNPFALALEFLHKTLDEYEPFKMMVKNGNIVRYNASREPKKDGGMDSDVPEVAIVPAGGTFNSSGRTSSSRAIRQRFQISVLTGDWRAHLKVFPLRWIIFCAFERFRDHITLNGFTKITKIDVLDFSDTMVTSGGEESRMPAGWATVLTVEVLLMVSIQEIER